MASPGGGLRVAVDDTLGAALIGFAVSCVVFGVLTMQVFTYFQKYPLDRPAYKSLVALIWALEVVDQVFIGHSVYYYVISNYTNPLILIVGDVVWSLMLQVVTGVLVGTIVKACFAMRVWRFSNKNLIITVLILALDFGQFGLGIAYAVKGFELRKFVFVSDLKTLASLSLGSGVVTDVIIAASLCFFLRKLRTGYKHSDSLVNQLTVYAVNTGALTSAISLCTLLLYNARPTKFYFMATYFILSKLYAISFMCTLNTRKIIRGRGTDRAGGGTDGQGTAQVHGHTFNIVNHAAFSLNSHHYQVHYHGRSHGGGGGGGHARSAGGIGGMDGDLEEGVGGGGGHQLGTKSVEIGVHQEVSVVSDHDGEQQMSGHFDSEAGRPYTIRGF